MKENERPFVYLPLSHILQDVVKHDSEQVGDGWLLSKTNTIGEFLTSLVRFTDVRPAVPSEPHLKLWLPLANWNKHGLKNHYATFRQVDIERTSWFVESIFRHRVMMWMDEGVQHGFTQKQVILALIEEYGFRASEDNFEMIKKMVYRERRRVRRELAASISCLVNGRPNRYKRRADVVI